MPLDLSTLTIPPADVVPEPTAEDVKAALANAKYPPWHNWEKTICWALRRCRELEAEVERLRKDKEGLLRGWSNG